MNGTIDLGPKAPKKGNRIITVVCACIKRAGGQQILLSLRRAPGVPALDGKWELPGGKIEFGETPDKAIVREIREELGIQIIPRRLLPYLHTNIWEYEHVVQHVVLACYECEVDGEELPKIEGRVQWCHVKDIDFELTLPGTKEFVGLALNEWFDKVWIRFEFKDEAKNSFKEFTVTTQPTLFSDYGLVKYWGRIGDRNLRTKIEEFDSPKELDQHILQVAKRRLSHGYRVAELEGSRKSYKSLIRIIELAKGRNLYSAPSST